MNTDKEKTIDKIRKLLRLNRGTNYSAEAQSAMAKAHELSASIGVAIEEIGNDDPNRIAHEQRGVRRVTLLRRIIFQILKKHFSVHVVQSYWKGAIYIGPAINLEIAKHIEHYLHRAASEAFYDYMAGLPAVKRRTAAQRRVIYKSYMMGFFGAIDRTLEESPKRNDAEAIGKAIEAYTNTKFYVMTKPNKPGTKSRNDDAASKGFGDGSNVDINRPVNGGKTMLQLTYRKRL